MDKEVKNRWIRRIDLEVDSFNIRLLETAL